MELQVGINIRGRAGLIVDRPYGAGNFVFVHFLESALLGRDHSYRVHPDTCIVYRPETPTVITGDERIYNSFLHVSADLAGQALRRHPIPLDQPIAPRTTEFVLPLLSRLQCEWVQRDHHWEAAIHLCVNDLFLNLSRGISEHTSPAVSRHADRLRQIRLEVHRAPAEPWTVAAMAERAHLKESQFSVLYKQLFSSPPMEDLLQARLALAKYYLANYELSIGDVAELCGFADLSYFSRRFRHHVGIPPSVFRHQARSPD